MNKDNGEIFSSIDASAMLQLAGNTTLHDHDGSTGPDSPSSKSFGDGSEQQAFSRKRKRSSSSWRTMRAFFEDLTTQLIERQDAMHRKFLETMERREEERARREEAYKRQEMARMSREQDLRAREKALAATRDAALVAFLQKVTGETLHLPELGSQSIPVNLAAPMSTAAAAAAGTNEPVNTPSAEDPHDGMKDGAGDGNCRRWPKVEVLALIRVRTSLESRFQEAGPKAQLWEEVAASMASLGFTRSGKRCKEKWENINKYYRKTRDNVGRKLRPESATKTCPYFNELELLYERGVLPSPSNNKASTCRLEGPQMSGEFVETSSRDESQHTLDGGGSADYPSGSSCISNVVPISSNLETNFDGRNVMLEMAATSSVGINGSVQSGERAHDLDFGADKNLKSDSASILCLVDQINVNCRPSQYLSAVDRVHDGKLASHEQMAPNVSSGILGAASASRFVRDIIGFQQQQQPPYGSRHQLDSAHLRFKHEMPSMEPENPACDEQVSELRMKLQNEDQRPRAMDPQGRSQSENVNLMTLVHKLGTSSTPNGSCEFRELLSPASSSAQV
ncbi:hypothetical protein KP509_03G031000 [Ceratopteris richardii]|nr:hypothetical protein KP509_03G031000 [Ceratopteris richardii]